MLKIIRKYLMGIIEDIDAGNSNMSEDDLLKVIDALRLLTKKDEGMSKYLAVNYLNISRATFDNYVRVGLIPKGTKVVGFNELRWYKKDLDKYIKDNKQ